MLDLNRLAILAQETGGIDDLAIFLNIDSDLLYRAFSGQKLSRREINIINSALAYFENNYIDDFTLAEIDDYTSQLDDLESIIDDFRNGDKMREAVISERLPLDELQNAWLLFGQGNLTPNVQNKIFDWLENEIDESGNIVDAKTFLELFADDGFRIDNIKDSLFWAWYRETFYND